MSAIFQRAPALERWTAVALGRHGTIDVLVRQPGYLDRLTEQGWQVAGFYGDHVGAQTNAAECRIRTAIQGWRGVEDEQGAPIPFTWEMLLRFCDQVPILFDRLLDLANDAYRNDVSTPP